MSSTNEEVSLCPTCKEPVGENYVVAGEARYHEEHFICGLCSETLINKPFFQGDSIGENYCATCYAEKIAKKCKACNLAIVETSEIIQTSSNDFIHRQCFICQQCLVSLNDDFVEDKMNRMLCLNCSEDNADKCSKCQLSIVDVSMTALGKKYHQACLVCTVCAEPIDGLLFVSHNDLPAHKHCVNRVCSFCNQVSCIKFIKNVSNCFIKTIEEDSCLNQAGLHFHAKCLNELKQEAPADAQKQAGEEEVQQTNIVHSEEGVVQVEQKEEEPTIENVENEQAVNQEQWAEKVEEVQVLTEKVVENEESHQQVIVEQPVSIVEQPIESAEKASEDVQQIVDKIAAVHSQQEKVESEIKQQEKHENVVVEETQTIIYSYLDLSSAVLPQNVDVIKREQYLSNEEFLKVFGITKSDFQNLKAWKQKELKQKFKLF